MVGGGGDAFWLGLMDDEDDEGRVVVVDGGDAFWLGLMNDEDTLWGR